MKLKKEFLCHTTDQEAMLVPTGRAGFAGLVRGNKTLGIILNLLEKHHPDPAGKGNHRGGNHRRDEGAF